MDILKIIEKYAVYKYLVQKYGKIGANFEVEEDIILQLKKIAEENERSVSAQLRVIILNYLKDYKNDNSRT